MCYMSSIGGSFIWSIVIHDYHTWKNVPVLFSAKSMIKNIYIDEDKLLSEDSWSDQSVRTWAASFWSQLTPNKMILTLALPTHYHLKLLNTFNSWWDELRPGRFVMLDRIQIKNSSWSRRFGMIVPKLVTCFKFVIHCLTDLLLYAYYNTMCLLTISWWNRTFKTFIKSRFLTTIHKKSTRPRNIYSLRVKLQSHAISFYGRSYFRHLEFLSTNSVSR